ncbi:tetratricopeptide repeat protein [Hyphobacterium marinum]|uniref:Tetratricopeptide repeat protein n=1 Tax=Hyphobacterium marinum TaxID=3116574 RepID=A0ABU7M0N2_9PROT|nr:tetratricopeptide repeat protein [Hyphobacterium sp. Y6023]MEE2567371.1 tetratricopeptide repeat protein [Hyphobacterium sp. Y6023]
MTSQTKVRSDRRFRWMLAMSAPLVALLIIFMSIADAEAQRRNRQEDQEGSEEDRTMSAQMGEPILEAQECLNNDNFTCVINTLTPLLSQSPNNFERFVIHRMRGVAYFSSDRSQQAIQDFEAAINTGAATTDERVALRMNIGQLYIVNEQYSQGIAAMEQAIREGATLNANLAMMLAQAYGQAERYSEGIRYAQIAFDQASPRERRHYDLLLFFLQQLDRVPQQRDLIQEMVERWPGERNYWTSLVALMARTNDEQGAFEANKLMYLNGMLNEEREIIRIAQYYSYFEYPYRGAVILEREMNAGRVNRTRQNLETLANMWRQAREFDRAIPVLRQLAQQSNSGDDYLKLAEALYQENELADAETAFEQALQRGGFNRPGDAWALLGTVRYERGNRQDALQAFGRCSNMTESRRTCQGWTTFINGELAAEEQARLLRIRVTVEECRNTIREELVIITLTGDEDSFDEEGRAIVTIPERCQPYFNQYGDQTAGPGFVAEVEEDAEADAEGAEASEAG